MIFINIFTVMANFKDVTNYIIASTVGAIVGVIAYTIKKKYATKKDVQKLEKQCELEKKKDDNHTKNIKEIVDNQCDNKIRYKHAETDETLRLREGMLELNRKYGISAPKATDKVQHQPSLRCWIKHFHSQYTIPDYSNIPLLKQILDGYPDDFKDAMMLHLLNSLGAMCYSKVRAKRDDVMHAPNLLTIVEGKQGSGKSKFDIVYKTLFKRLIEQDREKLAKDISENIIQTVGVNITKSKFIDILAANNGVHLYAMETELSRMLKVSHNGRSIGFIELRKAFDNEEIEQFNKNGKAKQGRYPVYFNCTLTGTPEAINNAFNIKEVNEGSARRFCFTVIPEPDAQCKKWKLPQGKKLEDIRDLIDSLRSTYCFRHDPVKGDIPCDEYEIDLGYMEEALESWLQTQYKIYLVDKVEMRNEVRFGIAAVAFHNAIVLHMLAGNPNSRQKAKRKTVIQLALYIADYCMERYLAKFVPEYNMTSVSTTDAEQSAQRPVQKKRELTIEEILYWYPRRGQLGDNGKTIGYGTIAKHLGLQDKNIVRNSFKRYEQGKL